MTFRKQILFGLIAVLAVPAFTYASSSGLTAYDVEHGQVLLLSGRASALEKAREATALSATQKKVAEPSQDRSQHQKAMETGIVRMTAGSMEGSAKK